MSGSQRREFDQEFAVHREEQAQLDLAMGQVVASGIDVDDIPGALDHMEDELMDPNKKFTKQELELKLAQLGLIEAEYGMTGEHQRQLKLLQDKISVLLKKH